MEMMWREISLRMRFTRPLCGGVPRDDRLVRTWLEVRQPTEAAYSQMQEHGVGPDARKPREMDEVEKEQKENTESTDLIDRVWVGFNEDKHGLFIRGANLRAHLKDSAQVLAPKVKKGYYGLPACGNFKKKLADHLYIKEERMYIQRQEDIQTKPTGYRDASLSVMTAQGPRTCLKRVDFVEGAVINATLQLLTGGEITRDHLDMLFQYGCIHGFGQDRSLQFGQYEFTLGE